MKTFFVEIMPCGTKAKTVNTCGSKKPECEFITSGCMCTTPEQLGCWKEQHQWQQAESERKVYEIENQDGINHLDEKGNIIETEFKYKPGSIHEATEINTKQIRIL